jgi:ribonuclease HII
MLTIGIDDAGRGPVIGPMVLAGVLVDEKQEAQLKMIKVKDSKLLSPKRREFLAREIKKIVSANCIIRISAEEIDGLMSSGTNLNKIEAIKCAEIVNILSKNIKSTNVIIDCPSTNIKAWQNTVMEDIKDRSKIKMKCEHKADLNHAPVSAASILAKVTRDDEVEKIKRQYNIDFGSGYPSDPLCVEFLKTPEAQELAKKGLIRKSWQTWKAEEQRKGQKNLLDF